ncbi:hypothetical protein L873DRAFT_435006 [Choiromyces venosus 120613-1]|uniref:Uncharacterized protein n=1 Tax=Choiromyces venosus 120613-1 TaxID=1336337 RepID=A0A3N4J054_9PEZI|nr:hypothetical protein L873DRAFT_435006 [Choiromyces venosus 120613-1]
MNLRWWARGGDYFLRWGILRLRRVRRGSLCGTRVLRKLPLPRRQQQYKTPPSSFRTLAAHPNIVGGKLSHGDISIHAQIALDPEIDHSNFHLFTDLGEQLFLVLQVGCCSVIDGLATIFLKTVVHLYNLITHTEAMDQETLDRVRELQHRVSRAEELIVKFGTVGIMEALARVLSFGEPDGGWLPLARRMEYEEWER